MDRKKLTAEILAARPAVMAYAMTLVRNYHVAEDLFQETMVAALYDLDKTARVDNLSAWLLGITRNKALKYFEREGREAPIGKLAEMAQAALLETEENPMRGEDRHEALRQCLEHLPARTLDVIRMRFEEDAPYSTIARCMRMSEQAIRKVVSRGRQALYHCIHHQMRTQS
ncbi:MAG: RNA polymerase sigma factor [Phycisphaeraceae bacterium]|nr:RNA polymerase sigma factor [Phycisphaeraceae bacterium]